MKSPRFSFILVFLNFVIDIIIVIITIIIIVVCYY